MGGTIRQQPLGTEANSQTLMIELAKELTGGSHQLSVAFEPMYDTHGLIIRGEERPMCPHCHVPHSVAHVLFPACSFAEVEQVTLVSSLWASRFVTFTVAK